MVTATLTTNEMAQELETDPKRFRKFLRSADSPVKPVGQGNRYVFTRGQVRSVKKAFAGWQSTHTRKAA